MLGRFKSVSTAVVMSGLAVAFAIPTLAQGTGGTPSNPAPGAAPQLPTFLAQEAPATPSTTSPQLPTFLSEEAPAAAPQLPTFLSETAPNVTCIAEGFTPQAATPLLIQVVIESGGAISGLPELLAPQEPSADVRKDYFGVITAAEDCAPLTSWTTAGEYYLNVSATGEMSAQLAASPVTAPVGSEQTATNPPLYQLPLDFGISSAQTEAALSLDRTAIRDVQARLLVSGHDPNGIDGVLGNGARAALSAWQTSTGKVATGFLNEPQLRHLQEVSEAPLALWLQTPANAERYKPTQAAPRKTQRAKKRVRVCKRNTIGILYDCKFTYR